VMKPEVGAASPSFHIPVQNHSFDRASRLIDVSPDEIVADIMKGDVEA